MHSELRGSRHILILLESEFESHLQIYRLQILISNKQEEADAAFCGSLADGRKCNYAAEKLSR